MERAWEMGHSEWVSVKKSQFLSLYIHEHLLTDESVVALGYEDTFGHHRRTAQHALFVPPFHCSMVVRANGL